MAKTTGKTETKRLSKGQRTHARRLKQAARKEIGTNSPQPRQVQPGPAPKKQEQPKKGKLMNSQEPREKQEEGKGFPGSAPTGHEPAQIPAGNQDAARPKGKIDGEGLLRWEDEGGQVTNRVDEGEESAH